MKSDELLKEIEQHIDSFRGDGTITKSFLHDLIERYGCLCHKEGYDSASREVVLAKPVPSRDERAELVTQPLPVVSLTDHVQHKARLFGEIYGMSSQKVSEQLKGLRLNWAIQAEAADEQLRTEGIEYTCLCGSKNKITPEQLSAAQTIRVKCATCANEWEVSS